MKQIVLFIAIVAMLSSCQDAPDTKIAGDTADSTTAKPAVELPYAIAYSSSFELGKMEDAAKILQGSWKDWETNNLDNMRNWVHDTILALHSDGSVVRGVDSLMARWKRQRATYTHIIDTVQAVTSLRSTDKKEDWVLVWAKEIGTRADGKKDTIELMETWRINPNGKADFLLQYERARRK